jgi:hypothetical protein
VPSDNIGVLVNHIQAVRKIPGLQSSHVVLVPESNLAFEGMWIEQEVKRTRLDNICTMKEDDNRAGVRTNNAMKKLMAMSLASLLNASRVCFHGEFVSVGDMHTPGAMREAIVEQVASYSRIIRPSTDIHRPPTETYGGKLGHGFDDLAIALMLNPVMERRFWENKTAYGRWHS